MNSFAPYDPSQKPEPLSIYKSALGGSNITTGPAQTPHKNEPADYNPPVNRRTIRVTKDHTPEILRDLNESRERHLYTEGRRFKESYSFTNGRSEPFRTDNQNLIYKSNAQSPVPNFSKANAIDPEAIKQLLNLQLQLQQNPNLIQQTQSLLENMNTSNQNVQGSVKSQNANLVQVTADLEREVGALRVENTVFKQTLKDLEFELENTKHQLTIEKNKTENLNNELESHQDLRDRLDEYALEIQKLEGERDFHHKNHVELRKELYNKTSAEFHINKLKRDLHYKTEELATAKDRCAELELQINELLIFAEKPRNEKQNNAETFYAKKIVELESTIKKLKDEKFEIENFHNTSFDNRRALMGEGGRGFERPSENNKLAQLEIDTLKRKVETLKSENDMVKKQLENARGAQRADSFTLNGEGGDRYQQSLKNYIREIEDLKSELRRLKNQPGPADTSRMDDFYSKTIEEQRQKISTLQQEKTALQMKIDTLNRELMEKNREISEMKQGNEMGVGDETVDNLREANKRMTVEIGRLQDQLRRMDSLNKSSMMSFNNKDRDWNKLLK